VILSGQGSIVVDSNPGPGIAPEPVQSYLFAAGEVVLIPANLVSAPASSSARGATSYWLDGRKA
jgi:hypothetical protein